MQETIIDLSARKLVKQDFYILMIISNPLWVQWIQYDVTNLRLCYDNDSQYYSVCGLVSVDIRFINSPNMFNMLYIAQ